MPDYFHIREKCPACFETIFDTLVSKDFHSAELLKILESYSIPTNELNVFNGVPYRLLECQNCGLIFQQYVLSDFMMKKLYQEWIDPSICEEYHARKITPQYLNYFSQQILHSIRYFDKPVAELKYLDYGMGWGDWCKIAKAYGIEVYGTEISDELISAAHISNIPVLPSDELLAYQFDLINANAVMEHLSNPLETLLQITKALKPSGLIKILVPNGWRIKSAIKRMDWSIPKGNKRSLNPVWPLEHINCFRYRSLITMANKANLKPVEIIPMPSSSTLLSLSVKDVLDGIYRRTIMKYLPKKTTIMFFKKAGV